MAGNVVPGVILGLAAAGAAPVALALGRGVADSLATRTPVVAVPPRQWVAILATRPRSGLVAAGVGAALTLRWSAAPVAAVAVLTASGVAVLAAMVDLRCQRLPDILVGPLFLGLVVVVGATAIRSADPRPLGAALLAGAVAAVLLGVGWAVGMGLGDVKFGAALGVLVGWPVGSWEGAVLAALVVVGGAATAASLWWGWCRLRGGGAPRWFPFGPFLAGAAILLLLAAGPPTTAAASGDRSPPSEAGTGSPCAPGPPVDSGVCSAS